MRHSTSPRGRCGICIVCSLVGLSLIGCSAGEAQRTTPSLRGVSAEPELRPVTVAADPTAGRRRSVSPIPEVISRRRPFRLREAIDSAVTDAAPLTMQPVPDSGAGIRVVGAEKPAAPRKLAGREAPVGEEPLAAEIRGMLAAYLGAFNRHDAAALAAYWSPSGENVDLESGEVTTGRDAVKQVFSALFAEDGAATIEIDVDAIRPLKPDVALVDGRSRIAFDDGAAAGSRFSAVVVRHDEGWLLESVREAVDPAIAAVGKPLDALAWLVGSWEDVGAGVTASTRCFWSTGRTFLVRTHAVAPDMAPETGPEAGDDRIPGLLPAADVGSRELTEIIGWDPQRQSLRSWVFTSDGRFAEGTWTREGDAWTIRVEGRGADADRDCCCTLVRTGPDSVSVRCSGDALADVLPPACDFTRRSR